VVIYMQKTGKKIPLLVLLGPTAVGKTALSVELAARLGGEIISGDSMQFYRYMDIGTAKIRPCEMLAASGQLIPHHLLDIVNPDQTYTVADFQRDAAAKIREIAERGKLPMLVGGTGLYVQALADGYDLAETASADEELRARLKQDYQALGGEQMHARLSAVDPVAAARISPNDAKRLLRALEVYELTGQPISTLGRAADSPYNVLFLGLNREREQLYRRIEQRVDIMLADGLEAECVYLLQAGFGADCKPMRGLGYRQMCQYLQGEIDYDEAVRLVKRDTRRFAKRQLTWWRRDERVHWFRPDLQPPEKILAEMAALAHEYFD
jgi:tRNA dimethylallyltransferase